MPVEYRYDSSTNLIGIRCFGTLTIDDISRYFVEITGDESVPRDAVELVDLTDVKDFSVSSSEASTMPHNYELVQKVKAIAATVLIAPEDANYGMARMIQAYFETNMPGHVFRIERSRADAIEVAQSLLESPQGVPTD